MAQKFLKDNLPEKLVVRHEAVRPPSKAAKSAGHALGRLVGRLFK